MPTTEERMKILKMIREGKITAEEGAKLLTALGEGSP
ncbi:MAG: SHOCT-like domain-containing protein, partial [Anaerolineales bacterium]